MLQVDASTSGACLLQEGKPVSHTSRSLAPAEENFYNIKSELSGIVYGCQQFHQYTFGREVNSSCWPEATTVNTIKSYVQNKVAKTTASAYEIATLYSRGVMDTRNTSENRPPMHYLELLSVIQHLDSHQVKKRKPQVNSDSKIG